MKYIRLGKTGMEVSRICLGMMSFGNQREWQLEIDQARPIVNKALDLGINCFDTADVYSYWADNSYPGKTEEIIGFAGSFPGTKKTAQAYCADQRLFRSAACRTYSALFRFKTTGGCPCCCHR